MFLTIMQLHTDGLYAGKCIFKNKNKIQIQNYILHF